MKRVLYFVILLFGCEKGGPAVALYSDRGQVTLSSSTFVSGTFMYSQASVTASFIQNALDPRAGCSKKTHGDCEIVECGGVVTGTPPDGGASIYVSAGEVQLTGAKQMVKLQVMTAGMFPGQYSVWNDGTPLFAAGDVLTVSAPGGLAPAFSATVTAPAQPVITTPALPATRIIEMPRDADFQLAWTGGGPGRLELQLRVTPASDMGFTTSTGLGCSFAAEANAGTIPSAALRALPAGRGTLYVAVGDRTRVTTSGWTIDVSAGTAPSAPNGTPWDDSVVVQVE